MLQKKNEGRITTRKMVFLALMIAMNVVLGRLSIQFTQEIRISVVGFLPIAMAAYLMGPAYGAMAGALGDIVNYLLFTHAFGPYFPGYSITAALSGMWYGMVLFDKEINWKRAVLAIVPVIVIGEMGLNSVWVYVLYSKTFWVKLPLRLLTNALEAPLKILLLKGMAHMLDRIPRANRML